MALASFAGSLLFLLAGFVEATQANGVVVLRREGASGIDLVAEGEIAAPPERVLTQLLAYDEHTEFVHGMAESRVLERGTKDLVVYQRLSLPVINDRDVTLRVAWGEEGGTKWLRFAAANERGPGPRKRVVRIPLEEGEWVLEPIDGGRATRARFSLRLDLAGSLPRVLCRSRAAGELPGVYEALRARLEPGR